MCVCMYIYIWSGSLAKTVEFESDKTPVSHHQIGNKKH